MMTFLTIIFWLSVFMIFYAYFGYPLCLMAILAVRKIKSLFIGMIPLPYEASAMSYELPIVSFIITAYNEEARIEEKLKNSIAQDYPKELLEILVASDCSNDKTDKIVNVYASQGVRLVRAPERKGKENAQKHAVDASHGDILVFSDVATILKPDAITSIVSNFRNPSIGCVSSEDKFMDKDGHVSGEASYVRYEMFLRKLESLVNTLVGLSGSFFAARREVCENWRTDLQSDFNTLLNSIRLGLKGVSDPSSIGFYNNISDESKEFKRKFRTVLRGITVLMNNFSLLNPLKYGIFSWQLISHKLCRWLVPFFMIFTYVTNAFLVKSSILFFSIFLFQNIFYIFALIYYKLEIFHTYSKTVSTASFLSIFFRRMLFFFKFSYFFSAVNFSILFAWWKYFKGERAIFWEPSKRDNISHF